jgi:hypothetical protein
MTPTLDELRAELALRDTLEARWLWMHRDEQHRRRQQCRDTMFEAKAKGDFTRYRELRQGWDQDQY